MTGTAGGADTDHGVLLSAPTVRGLAALGVPVRGWARPVEVIDLSFDAAPERAFTDAGAFSCSRSALDEALGRAALAAGVERVHGTVREVRREAGGYQAVLDDGRESVPVAAGHVVIATGAPASGPDGSRHTGGLACARRFTGVKLGTRMLLAMDLPATIGPADRPACAWAIPGPGRTVTVGVAQTGGPAPLGPAALMDRALRALAGACLGLEGTEPLGPLTSGPLHTGFTPARVSAADGLLVGDAAGLVNPFTGEGLSYAVQSAQLAADAIAARPSDPDAARRTYATRLGGTFVGYFETARHAARRYHLTWRVLADAAGSDHPFFAKARRAILLPDGLASLTAPERLSLSPREGVLAGKFTIACDEVAITTIRREWPFLARLVISGDVMAHGRLRPAVLFLAALLADGARPDPRRATTAAAIELATLGALAFLSPPPSRRHGRAADSAAIRRDDHLTGREVRRVARSRPPMGSI